ncbi:MAG: hypothetical protein LBV02_05890 [Bacteroidales bacterium]|jgi:hypothetical protein|nr:hypothetical protein [Bacteroidales bacterium]
MKKTLLLLFISFLCMGVFAQEEVIRGDTTNNATVVGLPLVKEQTQFNCLVKFKPLSTVLGAVFGVFNLEMAVVPYVAPKIGIPVEVQIAAGYGAFGIALLSGIEAVPLTHREKSGLFLDLLAGVVSANGFGFCTTAHAGYQWVSKKGFVLNPAIGIRYDTIINKPGLQIKIDIGFARKIKQ